MAIASISALSIWLSTASTLQAAWIDLRFLMRTSIHDRSSRNRPTLAPLWNRKKILGLDFPYYARNHQRT